MLNLFRYHEIAHITISRSGSVEAGLQWQWQWQWQCYYFNHNLPHFSMVFFSWRTDSFIYITVDKITNNPHSTTNLKQYPWWIWSVCGDKMLVSYWTWGRVGVISTSKICFLQLWQAANNKLTKHWSMSVVVQFANLSLWQWLMVVVSYATTMVVLHLTSC